MANWGRQECLYQGAPSKLIITGSYENITLQLAGTMGHCADGMSLLIQTDKLPDMLKAAL